MIAFKCIFMSAYFILSVKFVTIESTSKISSSYYVSRTIPHLYAFTVNNLKTYNEREIILSEKEITILTNSVQTYSDTKGRDKVFDKFDMKVQDIICTCSLIVKTKLGYLMNILEGLRSGGAIEVAKDKLSILKKEAGLMVLLFQKGKVKAGKWFWSYFLKILAIIEYESSRNFFGDTPFGEEELQSGLTTFIQYCKHKKYLPKNRTESELISKNPNVPINIFKELRASRIIAIDFLNAMEYKPIDYLYLKPLWDEHELLFGEITGSTVEWKPTIRRHAFEANKSKEYVANRQWISKPFGHLSYHMLIKQIVSVRVYIFLWVILVILNNEMPKMDDIRLKSVYAETLGTINMAHGFMPYTDSFFSDLVAALNYARNETQKHFDSIIARISVRVKEILVDLNGPNSRGNDWIIVDINEEFSYDMIMSIFQEFGGYFNRLEVKLRTLNYELALSLLIEGN